MKGKAWLCRKELFVLIDAEMKIEREVERHLYTQGGLE